MRRWRKFRAAVARRLDRRPILVFCGDSHVVVPRKAYRKGLFGGRRMRFVKAGGATALGLRRPDSRTQAAQQFRAALLPFDPTLRPIFQLGEVDCDFVLWDRARRRGEPLSTQLEASLASYEALLSEMVAAGYRNAVVTSAVLPTIREGDAQGGVARARKGVTATLSERTALTLEFNKRLRQIANRLGLSFVDFDPYLLDPKTGCIREEFRHHDPADHHLHPDTGAVLWAERISAALEIG